MARAPFAATLFVLLSASAVFFAGSVAAPAILERIGAGSGASGAMTAAVQLGFVAGTLLVVAFDLPDRWPPRWFLAGLLLAAAAANAALLWATSLPTALALRFLAGATAGPVYPIGMRLLATWYEGLGPRLGILLAAYTLGAGTAAMLRVAGAPAAPAVAGASILAIIATAVALRMVSGPRLQARQALDPKALMRSYQVPRYRWSSFGYFGHMWELFAFWGLVPFWLQAAGLDTRENQIALALVYAAGALGCLWAAYASPRIGSGRVAHIALAGSGLMCLLSPWLFQAPAPVVIAGTAVWGFLVIADSPMFSALSAQAAPPAYVGSALTMQNSIGFAIPVVPLLVIPPLVPLIGWRWALLPLAAGPLLGMVFTRQLARPQA